MDFSTTNERKPQRRGVPPAVRLSAVALFVIGVLLCKSVVALIVIFALGILPWLIYAQGVRRYLRFTALVLAPIAVALMLVWGVIVAAPPGMPIRSSPAEGILYAAVITLRLAVLSGILQAIFSGLKGNSLIASLNAWGVTGDLLVITLGTFVMLPEGRLRAEQVLTSRLARGLEKRRGFISNVKQLPHVLRPMLGWTLRAAIERAELWEHRGLLTRVKKHISPNSLGRKLSTSPQKDANKAPTSMYAHVCISSLTELSDAVIPRRITALSGDNFSGRTKALRSLVGLEQAPAQSNIQKGGAYIGPEVHSSMSGLAQTGEEELALHTEVEFPTRTITAVKELFGLEALANRNPTTLSGGEQVSLALTCAIANLPTTLAIDCAFEQLDYRLRAKFLTWLANNYDYAPTTIIADNRFDEFSEEEQRAISRIATINPPFTDLNEHFEYKSVICGDSFHYQCTAAPFSLSVEAVDYSYTKDKKVLRDVNITLPPGELFVIDGHNGSGKSTLAKLLSGVIKQNQGTLRKNGAAFNPWKSPGRYVAYHFQNPDVQLFETSVISEIRSGAVAHGLTGDDLKNQINSLTKAFGLSNIIDSHPLDLPFILRKRVAIAATLAAGCPWVILDEPTLGQDKESCSGLIKLLSSMKNIGVGLIIISHSASFKNNLIGAVRLSIKNGMLLRGES